MAEIRIDGFSKFIRVRIYDEESLIPQVSRITRFKTIFWLNSDQVGEEFPDPTDYEVFKS